MIENLGSMYFDRSNWKTALSYLTYQAQYRLFNFVNEKFPDNIQDFSDYYPYFFINDFFDIENNFQSVIKINLFNFVNEKFLNI